MNNLFVSAISLIGICLMSSTANATSYDCNKARTWVEKTICRTPELSKLDDQLAKHYQAEMEDAKDNATDSTKQVRTNQTQWLIFQRNTCKDKTCLIREYKERLGGKPKLGVAIDYPEDIAPTKLPKSTAFGTFSTKTRISMYNPDTKDNYDIINETNSLDILSVTKKPYLAVIDSTMIFSNAHLCDISDQLANWSENHWTLTHNIAGEPTELRLYPAIYQGKAQILIKDIDQKYREFSCGMRGYFDGMRLQKVK